MSKYSNRIKAMPLVKYKSQSLIFKNIISRWGSLKHLSVYTVFTLHHSN